MNLIGLFQPYCFCVWHFVQRFKAQLVCHLGAFLFWLCKGKKFRVVSGVKLSTPAVLTKVAAAEIRLLWSPVALQSALPACKLLLLRYLQMCYSACQNFLSTFGLDCLFFFF